MRRLLAVVALALALPAAIALPASAQHTPRTALHTLAATGARAPEELRERAAEAEAALAGCERHARPMGERAQATLRLEIDRRGRVRDVQVLAAPRAPRADAWLRCATRVLASLRFARGGAGTIDAVIDWAADPSDPAPVVAPPPPILAYPPHQRSLAGRRAPREPRPELTRDAIAAFIRANLAPIQRCYARDAEARPGRVLLELTIDPDGTVPVVRTLEDEIGSPTLDACVRYQVRGWRFPEHGGPPIVVRYPFAFGAP